MISDITWSISNGKYAYSNILLQFWKTTGKYWKTSRRIKKIDLPFLNSFIIFHSKSGCIPSCLRISSPKNHGTHIWSCFFSTCSHTTHCILFLQSIRMHHLSVTLITSLKKMLEATYSSSLLLFDFSNAESSNQLKLNLGSSLMELLFLILWRTWSIFCQRVSECELITSLFLKLKELKYQRFEHSYHHLRGYYSNH